ncbi:hypothetical protein BGZ65_001498 [Modicella reniformis]|uniref:Uncharacterized protein n=1 Tax=Modicella reniformis TaxID=1440133 RepID=A0A9P6ILU8_9FUNG|nr:hypothetical protein BGZ65_001498 [Modicella reniformis]
MRGKEPGLAEIPNGLAHGVTMIKVTRECEDLLQSYFQAIREERSRLYKEQVSSVSIMSTLLKLATSHAKASTSHLGFVPLADGAENMTRLYGPSHIQELIVPADDSVVPGFDFNEYGFETKAIVVDNEVPSTMEEERDNAMKRMHAHLIKINTNDYV